MRQPGLFLLLGIVLALVAPGAAGQGTWHGVERPALKAKDPDGQAAELLRHSETDLAAGRFGEALQAAEEALAILEKRYGAADRRLAPALKAIGAVHFRQARHKDVDAYYERAAALLEKGDPVAYANSLTDLGKLYINSGRAKQAVPLYRRALAVYEKAYGEDGRLQTWLINVANAESFAGNFAEAHGLLRRADAIAAKEGPVARASVDMWVAEVFLRERRYDEAAALQRVVIALYSSHFGPQHEALLPPYAGLVRALRGLGRIAEADEIRSRMSAIQSARPKR